MKKIFQIVFISGGFSLFSPFAGAQKPTDTLPPEATLEACVQFALKHYPLVQQALLDEKITDREIKSQLSDWYPQLGMNINYQNNFQLTPIYFNGNYVTSGTYNQSVAGFTLTQNIFNRDALLAIKTKNDVKTQSRQATVSDKIDVTVNVSKAFYDVLLTKQQIEVLEDDIVRLARNLKDTYNQYQGGLVDKTDYKRATIALNNSKAEKKSDEEALKAKLALLKQLMGYNGKDSLHLSYDSAQMEAEVFIDTSASVDYNHRIEYQLLLTQKRLQEADVKYNKWAYVPAISANAGYNFNFLNNDASKLYVNTYPTSYAGLQINLPIFQGTKRTQNIRIAEMQLERLDWDRINLETAISTQYAPSPGNLQGESQRLLCVKGEPWPGEGCLQYDRVAIPVRD